jgi:hypothetical protein
LVLTCTRYSGEKVPLNEEAFEELEESFRQSQRLENLNV